jgi:hypothetical protein
MGRNIGNIGDFEFLPSQHRGHELSSHILTCTVLRTNVYNQEERWLNGSAPDCKSVVLGSNPAPPQHTANSVSPEVGSHLG